MTISLNWQLIFHNLLVHQEVAWFGVGKSVESSGATCGVCEKPIKTKRLGTLSGCNNLNDQSLDTT